MYYFKLIGYNTTYFIFNNLASTRIHQLAYREQVV